MFSLGLKEFCRRVFSNLFIALQLAAVLFIIISIVSSVRSRIEYYKPVREYLSGDGLYGDLSTSYCGATNEEKLKEQFPQIENVICTYNPAIVVNGYKTVLSYSEKAGKMYVPPLKEGKWVSEIEADSETIGAVVNERSKLKLGDKIKGKYIYYEPDDVTYTNPIEEVYEIEVVGIISDKTKFFGGDKLFDINDDFRNLYGCGENAVVLMNQEQLTRLGIGYSISGQKMLIQFRKGLSDEEVKSVSGELKQLGGTIELEKFRDVSYMYVYHQLIQLLPILVSIVLLVLVSTIAISALSTKMSLHTYAVYYILGCTWKGCLVINLINSLLTAACSALMCGIFVNVLKITGKLQKTVITVGKYQLFWCAIMIAGFLLISMLMPALFMRTTTPKEHLTTNE